MITIPTPPRLPQPVRPQLTPLQILSLAQLWKDEPELALELATEYGKRPLGELVPVKRQ